MIYDKFALFDRYKVIAPEVWDKVKSFLIKTKQAPASGRFQISGDQCYANVSTYSTRELDPDLLEMHKEYLDIQITLEGRELIYCRDTSDLEELVPYSAGKDIAFYRMKPDCVTELVIGNGNFAIFYPGEGHLPGMNVILEQPETVLKVIVKIHKSLLK